MNRSQPVAGPWPVRLFALAARVLLPRDFVRRFGDDHLAALSDQYRVARRRGVVRLSFFWLREIAGLFVTSIREYRELLQRKRRPTGQGRQSEQSSLKRIPEMLNTLLKDVIYSLRMIVKTPVVSAIAVVSLAVGVSANTSIFSVLNSWLLRPLPYTDADRMLLIYENNRNDPDDTASPSIANYFDWRERASSFETWIASTFVQRSLTGIERPQRLTSAQVTPNFFSALGAEAMIGRTFLPDEGGPEDAPVAVIKETVWRNQFGADSSVVGTTIMLNNVAHTVVGVIPETFDYLLGTVTLWIPTTFEDRRDDRQVRLLRVAAWRKPEVTFERAEAEMVTIASRLEEEYPTENANWGVNVQTIREDFPADTDRGLILILMAVVGMTLLVACANVAGLLLAKTEARQKELAVRTALGAGKARIVQQLLSESMLLALIAGTLGTILSIWGVRGIAEAIPAQLPQLFLPRIDGQVIAFSLALSVVAGLAFGITPATQAISGDLRAALTDGGRSNTTSKTKKRLRGAFVMAQFALALITLIAAAVLTNMFHTVLDIDAGYDSDNLLTMEVTLPQFKYPDRDAMTRFVDNAQRELEQVSGVRGVAMANQLPRAFGLPNSPLTIDGRTVEQNEQPRASWLTFNTDYLNTMDIALRSGRGFTDGDRADGAPVVLVNQRMVERFFEGVDPVGQRITIREESREIVGVVVDVAQTRLAGLQPIQATVYFPMAQLPVRTFRIAIKTEGDPYHLAAPAQAAIWNVDPDQPVAAVQTLNEFIEIQLAAPVVLAQLLFIVGFLTLALAAIGIYGVMAFSVTQQTSEIGIRMALGAKPRQVLATITRQGAVLAGAGLLIGAPIAAVITKLIAALPVDIPGAPTNLGSVNVGPIVQVSLILTAVGLIACLLPARRATKIDPVAALREE